MKKIILLLIILFCFSGCSEYHPKPSPAKTSEWFSDKEFVILRYESDYWKKLSSFSQLRKRFSVNSFQITCGETGGMTKNFIEIRFRITPSNIKKYNQLYKIITSMGFYESINSPEILVSKLSSAERLVLKEKLKKKIQKIKNKMPLTLPQVFGTNFYWGLGYGAELGINNFESGVMLRREMFSVSPSIEIILPKAGCSVYLYLNSKFRRNARLLINNYILDELSEIIENDKYSKSYN